MGKLLYKIFIIFFIVILFYVINFFLLEVNADSVDWENVGYIQPYEGKNIYKNNRGYEILESTILHKKRKTEEKIYKITDVDSNRIKIEVTDGINQEGWINKTDVKFYPGQQIKFLSFVENGDEDEDYTWNTGKIVSRANNKTWNVKDDNGTWAIQISNIKLMNEGNDWGLDDDVVNDSTNAKNDLEDEILQDKNYADMSDQELIAAYQRILQYEEKYGVNNAEIEEEKTKIENELGARGYDINDLLSFQTGTNDEIFVQPERIEPENAGSSLNDLMGDAESFVSQGQNQLTAADLQNFSSTLYNIFLTVGIVVAVIVGAIIGIKLMASNIETKVEAKKLLIPYVVGCIVVFGAFGIWKIVVNILQQI